MSGHSKFANIKHKKEKNDATRGKVFTRLGREITVAVKQGGGDPSANSRLRDCIAKAKSNNMPNDTIDRCVKKAAGELDTVNYEYVTYEGYGPNGVAIIVEVLTDNRNRSAANVRNAFTKGGGNLGSTGCVSFMFEEKGYILVELSDEIIEDELMLLALDNGADEFTASSEGYEITCPTEEFTNLREVFENEGIPMMSAEISKTPQTFTKLNTEEDFKKMNKLLNLLDDEDDVQDIYHNWENEE